MEDLSYGFDGTKFKLGRLCKRGHEYLDSDKSLRKISDSKCPECVKEYAEQNRKKQAEYRASNRDKTLEKTKTYYAENREKLLEQKREYYAENRDEILKYKKIYYDENKEVIIEKSQKYYQENQEKIKTRLLEYRRNNRKKICDKQKQYAKTEQGRLADKKAHKKYSVTYKGMITKSKASAKRRLFIEPCEYFSLKGFSNHISKFESKCAYCRTEIDMSVRKSFHIDHFVSVSDGGKNDLSNLVLACPDCNLSKWKNDVYTWYSSKEFFTQENWERILWILFEDEIKKIA